MTAGLADQDGDGDSSVDLRNALDQYTSQTDAGCGYVDKRNRRKQEAFHCLWCGTTRHADVNAARNHLQRRSLPQRRDYRRHRDALLNLLVRLHVERFTRARGSPADPRLTNPYFKEWAEQVKLTRTPGNISG